MLLALVHVALAAPPDPEFPRLTRSLVRAARSADQGEDGDPVVVVVEGEADLAGTEIIARAAGLTQVRIARGDLGRLQAIPGVRRVREPYLALSKQTMSEGVAEVLDYDWHEGGQTGEGVRVAILDVGFAGLHDQLGSELPDEVSTRYSSSLQTSSHGVAVAEVVHDFAPDAELLLVQFRTDVEFLEAVDALAGDDVDVVNASIGFDDLWHADGTSPWSRAVDDLAASGVLWIAAAGNENDKYRVGALSDDDGDGLVEIAGAEGTWVYAPGGFLSVRFRWSDPMDAPIHDLDLVAWEEDGTECADSDEPQGAVGTTPLEAIEGAACDGEWLWVTPVASADVRGLEGFLYGVYGIDEEAWTWDRSLTLPADAAGAVAVAACYVETGTAPDYSSRGPSDDGRPKPDLCGPTDVSTETFGNGGFSGTSAAAPHVAGLAALGAGAWDWEGPDDVAAWMTMNAEDLGDDGWDATFGAGAARAGPPPERACGCGSRARHNDALVPALAFACLARRRRYG